MTRTTICLGAMAAVLMACGLRIGQAQTRGAGANDPMIPAPLLLNEDDHGATLDARVGQYVLIYLQDPYGGAYGWEVQEIQGEALKQIGRAEHVPGGWTPGQDTGRPAAACFRFAGVEEGQATVTLLCTPPPGLMVPVRFYEVTFNVRAAGLKADRSQTGGANDPMIPAPLLLNEDDHGATLDARVGQYVLIYLQDPYGGAYGWEVQAIQGEALKQMGRAEHVPGGWTPGQDTGRPAAACFRFAGVEEGQATVTLLCTPPPGLMVPVRFYEVTFNVRP